MISAFKYLLPVAALLLGSAVQADAQTYTKSARAGKTLELDSYSGWNNDCSSKIINVDVVGAPSGGSVSPKVISRRIAPGKIGSASHCVGKPTRAIAVYYTPRKGYAGRDTVRVRMSVGGSSKVFTYIISVR